MSLSLALCAILGFEPIVSTNWIFDDEDDENDELLILFPIAHFYTPVYAFDIFHNPSLLPPKLLLALSIYCCNKEFERRTISNGSLDLVCPFHNG